MNSELIEKIIKISFENNIDEALRLQKELFQFIKFKDKLKNIKFVGGVDISYSFDDAFCAIVVFSMDNFEIVEVVKEKLKINFPYVPGLLFFREFPVFYETFKKINKVPDLFMFDGHGLSHPRMMGIATMSGIVLDLPTIGCAKSPLFGVYKEPGEKKFSATPLLNQGKKVGYVLRSKEKCKPIFVSSGHKISPEAALEITKDLITRYRLPLPTYYAHKYATTIKNE